MDALWIGLGFVVLAVTLLDVFLTALNYDEAGVISGRIARGLWKLIRRFTRRLTRRWRPVVLRQVIGMQVIATILWWIVGTIIGYGLIYLGSMQGNNFTYSGVKADLFGAMYFSTAQLSTVGTSQLTPNTDFLRILSVVQTLSGVVLVSLILTFLLGVYDVVSRLRALSVQFYSAGSGVGEPIPSLVPYFPGGNEIGLDSHLESVADAFDSYTDGIRLHHEAYYFQSGRDTFSLPYSIDMLAGIIGALRWGLPASNPVTQQPTLEPLTAQFGDFAGYMHQLLRWTGNEVPATVSAADFARQVRAELATGKAPRRRRIHPAEGDLWVHEFIQVNQEMAALVNAKPFEDVDEAYTRYSEWLPFAFRAQEFSDAVTRDLDYQPVYSAPQDRAPIARLAPAPKPTTNRSDDRGVKALFARRVTLIDPGFSRLNSALRALLGAALAVVILVVGLPAIGQPAFPAAIFGGMIAMFTSASSGGGHGLRRLASLISLVPVGIALGLSTVVPHEPLPSSLVLALLAFTAVAASLLGKKFGGLGQLAFMSYYFTLLLDLQADESLLFVGAAGVGVLSSVLLQMVPNKGARARVVKGGVAAFEHRIVRALDAIIDTVSSARWDPDLMRRTRAGLRQVHHLASSLTGQLTGDNPDIGLSAEQAAALRIRVHDVELAFVNLYAKSRSATGSGIPLDVRAHLAGVLQSLQTRIASYPDQPAWASSPDDHTMDTTPAVAESLPAEIRPTDAAAHWPRAARRVLMDAHELQNAIDVLHLTRAADLTSDGVDPEPEDIAPADVESADTASVAVQNTSDETAAAGTSTAPSANAPTAAAGDPTPVWRRAVQAGASTLVALLLGSLVSTTHQYWAAMPAYQAIGGSDGETFVKGTQKVFGTVLGAITGFAIAITVGPEPAILLPILGLCVFAMTYFRSVSSPLTSFWMMMMFAMLYEFMGRLNTEAIEVRIAETIIGAGVALIVAALILPTRTRSKYAMQAAQLAKTVDSITTTAIDLWKRNRQPSAEELAALSKDEVTMTDQLRELQATANPLRYGSGAFEPGGIENQLTAFWELLYYTRHFIASTEQGRRAKAHLTTEQWEQLEASTAQNFDALVAAYQGRVPGPVRPDIGIDDLGDQDEPRAAEFALRALARANQTVAIMATDLAPQAGDNVLERAST